jgi:hypothetical protein
LRPLVRTVLQRNGVRERLADALVQVRPGWGAFSSSSAFCLLRVIFYL